MAVRYQVWLPTSAELRALYGRRWRGMAGWHWRADVVTAGPYDTRRAATMAAQADARQVRRADAEGRRWKVGCG